MNYAFDIGGSKIAFAVFDTTGKICLHRKIPTPTDDHNAFVGVLSELIAAADRHFSATPAIGISLAGGVDPQTGVVLSANIPAVRGWAIGPAFAKMLNRAVYVENDADCFALAEARIGIAKTARTVFAIILGTGVGGSIVVDGHFIGGHSGFRGEWGHGNDVSGALARHGLTPVVCGCGGAACLDPWGGARGLETIYTQIGGARLSSIAITESWHAGETLASRAVDIFVDLIAGELTAMINLLGPDQVPVGGGIASEQRLITALDDAVRARVLGRYHRPLIVPGTYYRDGGLRGAALLDTLNLTKERVS